MKISDHKFQDQLPASTSLVKIEPEEIVDTTWKYAPDYSGWSGLSMLVLVVPALWLGYKVLEVLWIIFSGLFVCVFLGC